MKKTKNIALIAIALFAFLGSPLVLQAANKPGQVVYTPSALRNAYRVDLRDISSTAPHADQIVVMDELPFVPFNVLEALQGRVPGVQVFTRGFLFVCRAARVAKSALRNQRHAGGCLGGEHA